MKGKFILMILCAVLGLQRLQGQSPYFKNYSVENGMPFISVSAIFQDTLGNLWLGGYGGLSKFDGIRFNNYSLKDGLISYDIISIAGDDQGNIYVGSAKGATKFPGTAFNKLNITTLMEDKQINLIIKDSKGNIWFGTQEGLIEMAQSNFSSYSKKDGLVSDNITALAEDMQGNIWIGTDNGVCFLNGKLTDTLGQKTILTGKKIHAIEVNQNNDVFIGTEAGLFKLDRKHDLSIYTQRDGLIDDNVTALISDKNNDLWIGTSSGLSKYDEKKFTNYTIGNTEKSNNVKCFYIDAEENLWIGSDGGLFRFHDVVFSNYNQPNGPVDKMIFPIYKDKHRTLWVGTEQDGLYKYVNNNFKHFTTADGLCSDRVNAIIEDNNGSLLIGTQSGLNSFGNNTFLNIDNDHVKNRPIYCFLYDHEKNLWMGSDSGAIKFDGKNYYFCHLRGKSAGYQLWSIAQDKSGTLWFATYNGGLIRMTNKDTVECSDQLGFKSDSYLSVLVDSDNYIYFGAMGGVYVYDLNHPDQQSLHLTESNGLSSDLVYSMIFDQHQKNLWVGTNQGLNKVDLEQLKRTKQFKVETFGKEDGFEGVESNTNAACLDTAGTIWFGSLTGLLKYDPSRHIYNYVKSKTSITGFNLYYRDTLLTPGIRLNHLSNNITFYFNGICFTDPSKVFYRYVLEGFDHDWSPAAKNRSANYSNLPPGDYTFKVISCNNEGSWNMIPASFHFFIQPAFWQTWWFRICIAVLLAAAAFAFYRYRLQQQLKLLRVRDRISRDLHDDIGSTLSSISYFSEYIKQQTAHTHIKPFADKIGESSRRMIEAMNDIVWAINPKNDSFEVIISRMNEYLYQATAIKNIKSVLQVPKEVKNLTLSMEARKNFYLIFKEAVNNAVKYSCCSELIVEVNTSNSSIIMSIADNGLGFDPKNCKQGNGITNMQNRAGEMNGKFKIESEQNIGTKITLQFNIP